MMLVTSGGLEPSTAAKLKWRVCRLLEIKPYSREWIRLTRRRVLICALQLVLERAAEQTPAEKDWANPNFDEEKFNELRRGSDG